MRPEKIEFQNGMPIKISTECVLEYPYNWHDTFEIILIKKGQLNITLGDDNLLLNETDIAVININELHRITESHNNEVVFIHIESDFFRNFLGGRNYEYIYCCSADRKSDSIEKFSILRDYIYQLVYMYKLTMEDESNYSQMIKKIENTLDYIVHNFSFLRWGYGTTEFNEENINRFIQLAERTSSNFQQNFKLKELADELNISPQHLCYNIKENFGETFLNLLFYSKCESAAKLILTTNNRIIDIALECGFSDVKYLIKYFKIFFQVTPSEFRKKFK